MVGVDVLIYILLYFDKFSKILTWIYIYMTLKLGFNSKSYSEGFGSCKTHLVSVGVGVVVVEGRK